MKPLISITLLKLFLHLATNNRWLGYGYFRDEFYYLTCAERLDFGYVDLPPLVPLLLSINRRLLGDSLFALRLLPAVAGAATVFLTGLMARRLGGGRFAQALAALAVTIAPVHLVINGFFSPNAFEVLLWIVAAYILLLLLQRDSPRLWLWVGVIAGLGLQMKHTMALFGLGMLLTQVLTMHPLTSPIWLAGLYFLLFAADGKPYRMIGWIYLVILFVLITGQSSRPDRLAGAYPMLLAPGAVVIERTVARSRQRRALAVAVMLILAVGGIVTLPIGIPVLPPETTARYVAMLGVSVQIEQGKTGSLPQYFADRLGWEEMVTTVAEVYHSLPPDERAKATILTGNYGQAGAVDFLGRELDLPRAISSHNNYFLWGPGDASGAVVISIGLSEGDLQEFFEDVMWAATAHCDYCLRRERPIYVARRLRFPIQEVWPQVKHYD